MEYKSIQERICNDTTERMLKAKEIRNKALFDENKRNLHEVLESIKNVDNSLYKQYVSYLETEY